MKKSDQKIADELTAYNLSLIKYGNKTTREVVQFLNDLEKNILGQLSGDIPDWKKRRLNATLREIGTTTTDYYNRIAATVDADLSQIPGVAQSAMSTAVKDTLGIEFTALASPARLEAMATSSLIQGAPSAAWWRKQDSDLKFKVQNILRQGHAQGIGTRVIARDVKTAMDISKRHAETLVRTSVMSVNNNALQDIYKANSDIIDKEEWLSTLDSRTCTYCMSMDGRTYKVDATKPDIPAHMNCRCVMTPVVKTWRQMGINVDELTPLRRDMDGIVEGDTTFDSFLKRKGKVFQEGMLGKGRADLWRSGKITLSDLVTNRGRELSLAELKKL